jgi:serine/threonine-protein kinase
VPARVGRFEVRAVLGEGAFGSVYLAFDPDLNRSVALKVPRPGMLTGEFLDRFLREAKAAAAIDHPNVCPVYEVGSTQGIPYIVMRYVPGPTLADLLERRGRPLAEVHAVCVVRALALAVEAAHKRGVIHRDLKPGNVLIDPDRHDVLITDFGLARMTGEVRVGATQAGQILGTPAYMSPEQARGDVAAVGPCSDIYALGVILYELLTGTVPFGGGVRGVLAAVATGRDPDPPSARRPGMHPDLDRVCLRAMARNPADRHRSARELADDLDRLARAVPTTPAAEPAVTTELAFTTDPAPRWPRAAPRGPRWVLPAAVVAAAAVLVGAVLVGRHLLWSAPAETAQGSAPDRPRSTTRSGNHGPPAGGPEPTTGRGGEPERRPEPPPAVAIAPAPRPVVPRERGLDGKPLPPGWKVYRPAGGGFAVALPGRPRPGAAFFRFLNWGGATATVSGTVYSADTADGGLQCRVGVVVFPSPIPAGERGAAVRTVIGWVKADLPNTREKERRGATLGEKPATEVVIEPVNGPGAVAVVRAAADGPRVYVLWVMGKEGRAPSEAEAAFFNNFDPAALGK